MSWHFVQGCSLLNLLVSEISRIQVGVVLSCLSVAVLMTRAFWLAHRYAKMEALEAQKPVERELAMKAVHFSKRMRWLDTSVVFTGLF